MKILVLAAVAALGLTACAEIQTATGIPVGVQQSIAIAVAADQFGLNVSQATLVASLVSAAQQRNVINDAELVNLELSAREWVSDCVEISQVRGQQVVSECDQFVYRVR